MFTGSEIRQLMLLRVVRGRVLPGCEDAFVEVCRQQVAQRAQAPGLTAFMAGYRRVEGHDSFILASTWSSEAAAQRGAGDPPRVYDNLRDVAEVDSLDRYQVFGPPYRGILDAPGAILRVGTATIRAGRRAALHQSIADRRRSFGGEQLMLGWMMGDRETDGEQRIFAVTAWASPLVIEALAEPGRSGTSLLAAAEEFVTDIAVENFQAIGLQLPAHLADLGSRRVMAARFASRAAAEAAQAALAASLKSVHETPISLAPLGSPGRASAEGAQVLVARVSMIEYGRAERLVADHGGEVILATTDAA
ncbi:hypothetical protein BH24CHL5_BH24CHL5_09490 [soil metagenome]